MVRNTGKPNAPLLPRLNFTPFIRPPLPPCEAVHGDGRLQSVFNSSTLLFLPNYFPLFRCGSSTWAAVLQEKPAPAGLLLHETQLLQGVSTCSIMVSSMEPLLQHLGHLLPSSSSFPLDVCEAFSDAVLLTPCCHVGLEPSGQSLLCLTPCRHAALQAPATTWAP